MLQKSKDSLSAVSQKAPKGTEIVLLWICFVDQQNILLKFRSLKQVCFINIKIWKSTALTTKPLTDHSQSLKSDACNTTTEPSFTTPCLIQTCCNAQQSCDPMLFSSQWNEFSHRRHHSALPQKLDYTQSTKAVVTIEVKVLKYRTWPKIPMSQKAFHAKQKLEGKRGKTQVFHESSMS